MRRVGVVAVATACMVGGMLVAASPAAAEANRVVAFWSMDEDPGATVMVDSVGNHHGDIGSEVETGVVYEGATAHRWLRRGPNAGYDVPGHVTTVPHSDDFDPQREDFSFTIRYRTTNSFGNIMQKGQGTANGGYWKLEGPSGKPRCLFRGSQGESRTSGALESIADGEWHTVTCHRTSTYVEMYIDGVRQNRRRGPTGNIDNNWDFAIGGKSFCNGVTVTCDYFGGDIDYVKLLKGSTSVSNSPPVARLSTNCSGLICSFSGAQSTDSDGAIQDYSWNYGDGSSESTGSVKQTNHTFSEAGTYTVRLTVTDDDGAMHSTTQQVVVAPIPEIISFVGSDTSNSNATSHRVTVPNSVQPGDGLVLFFSHRKQIDVGNPTGVGGWRQLESLNTSAGNGKTTAWSKVADGNDAGDDLTVSLPERAKGNLVLAAYRGTDDTDPVAAVMATSDPATTHLRTTPFAPVDQPQSWGLSYWMHGDGTTSQLTPPDGVTVRSNSSQSGGGRVTAMLADSNASIPEGSYGGLTAVAPQAGWISTTMTVILDPAPAGPPLPNVAPTAALAADCTDLTCTFDASGSDDLDGFVETYEFDFGDGTTPVSGSQSTRTHTYDAADEHTATVTVIDNDGDSDTATADVTVTDPPPPPPPGADPIEFVAANDATGNLSSHSVGVPAAVEEGDVMVAVLTAGKTLTFGDPGPGWERHSTATDSRMTGALWTKVADATDAGSTVTVDPSERVKASLIVTAYRGVDDADPVLDHAWAPQPVSADRTTPEIALNGASPWALSYWSHRDGSSTSFSVPAEVTERASTSQSGGGRITALLADSDGAVTGGTYGGLTATTQDSSSRGITWTVLLRPES